MTTRRKKQQELRPSELLVVFFSLAFWLGFIFLYWNVMEGKSLGIEKTLHELADQIEGHELAVELKSKKGPRNLASTQSVLIWKKERRLPSGRLGKDPWGEAFFYRVVENKRYIRIYVWSKGPNKENETRNASLKGMKFSGDDVGYLREIKRVL